MAYKKAAGVRRDPVSVPQIAGPIHHAHFQIDAADGLLAADVHEIGAIPARCEIVYAFAKGENLASAQVVNVGFMSGTYGDPDDSRTCGKELFDSVDPTADNDIDPLTAAGLDVGDDDRGIGVFPDSDITAGSDQKVHVFLQYRFVEE